MLTENLLLSLSRLAAATGGILISRFLAQRLRDLLRPLRRSKNKAEEGGDMNTQTREFINSIGAFNTPPVTHSTYANYRDPTEWEKIYVGVESGKVVTAPSWNPYLLGKSFDMISQWVLREGGEIRAISPVGWHTCVDEPNLACGACECVDDPKHPTGYVLTVKVYRRKLIEFLDGDRHGAVNRKDIRTVHYPEPPPRPAPTPEELRAKADALTAAWEKICERIGKKKSA